jgi:hypothetical protein
MKYKNIKSGNYDSKREAKRAGELKLLERAKIISDLKEQVIFNLVPACAKADGTKERPVTYTADFVYIENGIQVVEDCKGVKTQQYIIRRKLMLFLLGVTVKEV